MSLQGSRQKKTKLQKKMSENQVTPAPVMLTPAMLSSVLAQGALIELGILGLTGHSLLQSVFGKRGARLVYLSMGAAAAYRAVTHIEGPNRNQIGKFDE